MSDPLSHRRRLSLLRPLLLAVAGVVVLGLSVWLSERNEDVATPPGPMAPAPRPPIATGASQPSVASVPTVSPAPAKMVPSAPASAPPTLPSTGSQDAPPAPNPLAVLPPTKPRFDIVRVSPEGDAVVAGRAEPGATVVITSNGHEIGRVQADSSGQFVFVPTERLPAGGQELSLEAHLGDQPPLRADGPVLLLVPPRTASAPAGAAVPPGSAVADAAPTQQTSIAVLTAPNAASRLLQGPASDTAQKLGLDVVDYDQHGNIRFAGKAPSDSVVRLYVDNKLLGEARSDPGGQWALTPPGSMAEGQHQLRLDQVSPGGKVVARLEIPFHRAVLAAQDVPSGRMIVQPEQSLWRIARQTYGEGIRYTEIFAANREKIRDPNLIFPGQILSLPVASPIPSASSTSR